MFETATNDVGSSASRVAISAAPAATLRAAIASNENVCGLSLRVYENLRDRIVQNQQTTYSEVPSTVTSGLSTNIDQLETLVDSLNSGCGSLHICLAAAEHGVRILESLPVSTAPLANIPTPTSPVASVPYSIPIPPVNDAHTSQVGAASQTPNTPSRFEPNLSPQRVRRNPVPHDSSAPAHSEHHVIAPRHLRAVSPWRAANTDVATASVTRTLVPSYASTANPFYVTNRVPGLEPKRTLLPPFAIVVSYGIYRLHEKRTVLAPYENLELHRIKRKIEGLIPTLKPFNGTNPVQLLRYFAELRHGFDALGVPEATSVRSIHFFLEGEAKSVAGTGALSADLDRLRTRDRTP